MTRNRAAQVVLLVGSLMFASGCTSFVVHKSKALLGTTASDQSTTVTFYGSYWGLNWSGQDRFPTDEEYVGIDKVITHSNFGYSLAGILTLGAWVPMTIEYWGLEERADDDDDGELDPEGEGGQR